MAGQQLARIFDPHLALDHAFSQVAEGGENAHCQPNQRAREQVDPGWRAQSLVQGRQPQPAQHPKGQPAQVAFPGFLGAEARGKRVAAKAAADQVSAGIRQPDRGQHQEHPPLPIRQQAQRNHVRANPAQVEDAHQRDGQVTGGLLPAALILHQVVNHAEQDGCAQPGGRAIEPPHLARHNQRQHAAYHQNAGGLKSAGAPQVHILPGCQAQEGRDQGQVNPSSPHNGGDPNGQ